MTSADRYANGPIPQRVARRTVLRWVLGGSASLMVVGPVVTGSAQASSGGLSAELSTEARGQVSELARRIRSGEATVLRDGTVIVEGWYLPSEYVRRIKQIGSEDRLGTRFGSSRAGWAIQGSNL